VGFSTLDAIARAEAYSEAYSDAEDLPELEVDPTGANTSPAVVPSTTLPPYTQSPPPKRLTKNQKKNLKDRQARKVTRELNGSGPKECSQKYRELAKKHPLGVESNAAYDLPHSKPSWIGLREIEEDRVVYGLAELQQKFKLQLFEWDGK
jgi:hypothetical protein